MTRSRIPSLYVVCLILLCSFVLANGQGNRNDDDFGFIERQVGLTLNTPQAYEGYTLFAPKHYTRTYLMDNQGGIINT